MRKIVTEMLRNLKKCGNLYSITFRTGVFSTKCRANIPSAVIRVIPKKNHKRKSGCWKIHWLTRNRRKSFSTKEIWLTCWCLLIEVFHSFVMMYANNRTEFDINVMDARIKLAAIDYNSNVDKKQVVVVNPRRGSAILGEKMEVSSCEAI